MSTTVESTEPLVDVDVAAIPTGGQLRHAMYGSKGMLLLSAGSTVTESIKTILTDRGIEQVHLHPDDAEVLLNATEPPSSGPAARLNEDVSEQLDEPIDEPSSGSDESGPPVRDRMVTNSRETHDPQRRERLTTEHREAADSLDSMMRAAFRGGSVDGHDVRRLTRASLENMMQDCETSFTVASQADQKGVSQQSLQTSFLAMAVGVEMGLDADSVRTIGSTGLVADWGMMHLPEDVRGSKGQLDERQFYEVQKVPIFTANMLQRTSALPRLVLPIAYQVHEKIDGSGYPRGKRGDAIHPFAKILHVADLYTSLTAPGPTRQPAMPYAAMESILREVNKRSVDADVARALLRVLSLFPIGSYVALSNNSVGRVIRRNEANYASPIVQIVLDARGNRISPENRGAVVAPDEVGLTITRALPTPGRNELSSAELRRLA